ncbi:MAG: hypothetical protein HY270_03195, partial [Deltaproteobacteria bacterium]|nr:hypothetical protein [Deltaproteobacteria bacterium]
MRMGRFAFVGLLAIAVARSVFAADCDPNDPTLIKPNLRALTPRRARVVQRDGTRRLYFSTVVANLGRGPLAITAKTVDTPFGPVTRG